MTLLTSMPRARSRIGHWVRSIVWTAMPSNTAWIDRHKFDVFGTPPVFNNIYPADGATGVDHWTVVSFYVSCVKSHVDIGTIDVKINGAKAISYGTFVYPFYGTMVHNAAGYIVTINTAISYTYDAVIVVDASAADGHIQYIEWYFIISPAPPPPEDMFVLPLSGGGFGVTNLPDYILIDGYKSLPKWRWNAADLTTGSNWIKDGYGATLTLTGSTINPTISNLSPWSSTRNKSVEWIKSGITDNYTQKAYRAAVASICDIDTHDVIFEFVVKFTDINLTGTPYLADKIGSTGWYIYLSSTLQIKCTMYDGTHLLGATSAALTANTWYHVLIVKSTTKLAIIVNGVQSGATINIATLTSISSTNRLSLGGHDFNANGVSYPWGGSISYFAMHRMDAGTIATDLSTFIGHTAAEERYLRVADLWPTYAEGVARPTSWGRASTAWVERKIGTDTTFLKVGSNFMRQSSITDDLGVDFNGLLCETGTVNSIPASSLEHGSIGIPVASPFQKNNAIVYEDNPLLRYVIPTQTDYVWYIVSVYAKTIFVPPSDTGFIEIYFYKAGGEGAIRARFTGVALNLYSVWADGVHTDIAALASAGRSQALGNGWYRLWLAFKSNNTANKFTDLYFYGGAVAAVGNMTLFGAQYEISTSVPTSYVEGTRANDSLLYAGSGNLWTNPLTCNGRCAIETVVDSPGQSGWAPTGAPYVPYALRSAVLGSVTKGSYHANWNAEVATVYPHAFVSEARMNIVSEWTSGYVEGPVKEMMDRKKHSCDYRWRTHDSSIIVDTIAGATDVVALPTAGPDTLSLGMGMHPCVISNLKIKR